MKNKTLFLTALLLLTNLISAQKPENKLKYSGFSGGMLLHAGYVQSGKFLFENASGAGTKTMQLKGLGAGIGGQARVHFGKHLRAGTEGYVTEHQYANGSYASIGWGGLLADYIWEVKKFSFFAGGTFGGGSQKNITNFSAPKNDFTIDETVSYRKYGFLCAVPFVGVEYALSKKIHLMCKADYIFNISNPQSDFVTGTRLYFGFSFCR
jgi:hypothetical protein